MRRKSIIRFILISIAAILALISVQSHAVVGDVWTPVAPLPLAVMGSGVAVANDKIYSIGGDFTGCCDDLSTDKVQAYDPSTNIWTLGAPMLAPRSYATAVARGNDIYVFGGRYAEGGYPLLSSVEKYDTVTNTWVAGLAPMPTARAGAGGALVGDRIYVMGGTLGSEYTNVVEAYDPNIDSWTTDLAPMPIALNQFGIVVVGNKILIVGGDSFPDPISNVY